MTSKEMEAYQAGVRSMKEQLDKEMVAHIITIKTLHEKEAEISRYRQMLHIDPRPKD